MFFNKYWLLLLTLLGNKINQKTDYPRKIWIFVYKLYVYRTKITTTVNNSILLMQKLYCILREERHIFMFKNNCHNDH